MGVAWDTTVAMTRLKAAAGRAAVVSVAIVAGLALTGCDGDDAPPADTTALTPQVPDGEYLCEFVPEASVVLALGADELASDGRVTRGPTRGRPDDTLSAATCDVAVEDDDVLSVDVSYMLGYAGDGFRDRLSWDEFNQLADDAGLGYSWTDEPDGDDPGVGEARLSHGDYLIEVRVVGIAEGRDPEADAVAWAQQTVQTLEIPDEWTWPGQPPSR